MKKLVPKNAILIPDNAECVFRGAIFDTYQWNEPDFAGGTLRFEMIKRPDTVSVMCVVDGKLLVLDEVQPHRGARRNFPGGRVDETDETIIAAAQREVHEETGYRFKNWRLVKVAQPVAKLEWFVYTVMAWKMTRQDEPHRDAGEQIEVQLIDFRDVKRMAEAGEGYLFEVVDVLAEVEDVDGLVALPEYSGIQIER